jgi:hypothetical protein
MIVMENFGPVILIEGILVFGGVLLFAWWQLRDLKREREKDLRKKQEAAQEKADENS